MVLRAFKNIPQRMDGTRRSELGMFVTVAAQAATAAASGPRWRCPPVRDYSVGGPTRVRGPPTQTAFGLRAAVKERHMRRLAVALALTLPMMVALARSAWPLDSPPADASTSPTPEERRLSHLHGLTMRTIPEITPKRAIRESAVDMARRAVSKHVSQATRLRPPGSKVGPLAWHLRAPGL